MHRGCQSQVGKSVWDGAGVRAKDDHAGSGPCQIFARNCATRNLRRPTTQPSAAPFTCSVTWVGEVVHGDVKHLSIDGKDGVAGSIPAGAPHRL